MVYFFIEDNEKDNSAIMNKATTKMMEEKKQREHLLQLNQILAKQVMEMSKIVAGRKQLPHYDCMFKIMCKYCFHYLRFFYS